MSLHADLSSVLSSIEQLVERLDEAAAGVDGEEREDLLISLHEVERHLRSAGRRLARTVDGLPGR